eukprot:TRINITY_DN6363_c0_g1_i2.p1 TRINITY_DN6363_c0_g1~~TRINITY_DN6363_c0_g1_i2.p1  ORF type:complete len:301 (+),score=59.41 TRINITY_DN6363_c0_g1_i2:95-904(+)
MKGTLVFCLLVAVALVNAVDPPIVDGFIVQKTPNRFVAFRNQCTSFDIGGGTVWTYATWDNTTVNTLFCMEANCKNCTVVTSDPITADNFGSTNITVPQGWSFAEVWFIGNCTGQMYGISAGDATCDDDSSIVYNTTTKLFDIRDCENCTCAPRLSVATSTCFNPSPPEDMDQSGAKLYFAAEETSYGLNGIIGLQSSASSQSSVSGQTSISGQSSASGQTGQSSTSGQTSASGSTGKSSNSRQTISGDDSSAAFLTLQLFVVVLCLLF